MKNILKEFKLAKLTLKNRVVMPPMTRCRATPETNVPSDMMVKYYGDRAGAGLIITEGTPISELGRGYAYTPGIYTKDQINAWKKITKAVHDKGGAIFCQIWHCGRISHPGVNGGHQPVSSSDIHNDTLKSFVPGQGFVPVPKPRALTKEEIKGVVNEFRQAGINALEAGFDGVEVHAANGYLINQFLDSEANNRTDEYGGSVENRMRFLKEVVVALKESIGVDKVGVRLAPLTTLNGTVDKTPEETYLATAKMLNEHGVAYIHIAEADWDDAPLMPIEFKQKLRDAFKGAMIYAGKYTLEKAEEALKSGVADLIGFGRYFISNPDLVDRIKHDHPWSALPERDFLFEGGEQGLNTYPAYKH